ncbi:hypothetical protein IE81DRAFT_196503 [Ceraceosorus guamensis]|uniref:Uncharacterized protein n=1 Tax=Ceraceosorus guamensis TaxID=1522189 RepID=A0A316VTZ9_9BASI|nr:hypothetical protein IE81DRAFT_196503 [Ceraceosorus guamensis]PWN40992.1 hypothetical protein IE81DRAFT_196503 [Ceraceosorus guamensis]
MSLWLAAFERRHFSVLKQEDHLHSRALHLKHRLEHERTPDGLILPLISTYAIWQSAILIIGLVACATLIMSCVRDDLFHSPR